LWVDDYEPALSLYKALFGLSGYSVLTASSGFKALDLLKNNHVDAVVTDYEMPGMDGLAVAKAVREMVPGVPVILFSGNPPHSSHLGGVVDGVCDKSDSREKLSALIEKLLCQEYGRALVPAPSVVEEATSQLSA
jgi:CheY-like chemotaxis protein